MTPNSSTGTVRVVFLQPVTPGEDNIFISKDDDDIVLPLEVGEAWGFSKVTILADDYEYKAPNAQYAYGYADVTFVTEP